MRANRVVVGAVAVVTAFVVSGCGGGGGPEVPTAGGGGSGASRSVGAGGGKGALAEYVEGKRAWVKCMRKQGFDFDDPDAKGQIDFGGAEEVGALKKDPKYIPALRACESVDPPMPEGLEESLNPLTPEEIKVREEYAVCMRKNGAPDFPDPDSRGSDDAAPDWDQDSAGAKRATRICGPIIGTPDNPPPAKG
ncbi:hypothetical protein ACFW9D_36335 [Streptomyces sp. NPDC059524]|uniref:hypothetical protein n=1 Tax=Streptomyces sp. NPDC059524 TaxID=3346856 RepID=UPI0036AAB9C5